jgi:hypothetical protein
MNRSNGAVWVLAELHLKLLHLKLLHLKLLHLKLLHLKLLHLKLLHLKSPSNLLCHDNRSMTEP